MTRLTEILDFSSEIVRRRIWMSEVEAELSIGPACWTLKSKFQNFASAMDRGSSRQFSPMHFNLSLGTSAVEYLAFVFIKVENFCLKIPSKFDETVWNGEKKQMGIKVARFSNCMEGIDSCTENLISPWWFVGTQSRFHHVIDYESQKSALPHVGPYAKAQCNNRSLATAFGLLIGRKFSLNQSGSR